VKVPANQQPMPGWVPWMFGAVILLAFAGMALKAYTISRASAKDVGTAMVIGSAGQAVRGLFR